ncbi:MAG: 8-amino-7-oxononanoate synthase [Sulfuriflexus sp.]|nr:8-amino-7-oxononanoate synthase [Sulfuriflexus sp.]
MFELDGFLQQQREQELYRARITCEGAQGPLQVCDGKPFLSFCSNDYLGLAADPRIADSLRKATEQYGVGSGAAHLINGHTSAHHALEEELAEFTGRERALLFSTGYMANLGVVSALVGRNDEVVADKLVHASLIDAAKLSGAKLKRYQHADVASLASRLEKPITSKRLVVTDGVFSMDGDIAPLPEIINKIGDSKNTATLLDDAHGIGVLGQHGRGCVEHFDCNSDVDILMATLGKAFGTFGAFVAGSEELIETLIQSARSYIFTTAMPAAIAEATRTSLKIVQTENERREKLQQLIKQFRAGAQQLGLRLADSITPIQPIIVGSAEQAVKMSKALADKGILVSAIRPPTVPAGTARLRITFSAAHNEKQVEELLSALESLV